MKPPSPPSLPLIGHIPAFRRDVLGLIVRSVREYGDVIRFKLGPHPIYLVNHPDAILHVLKKNAANYDKDTRSTRFLRDIASESLLTSNGEAWRQRRQHLQPAFHRQAIEGFASIMREEAEFLVHSWKNQSQVNASADLTTTTFSIVARSLFGSDVARATLASLAAPIAQVLTEAFTRLGSLTGRKSRKFVSAMSQLNAVVDSVIAALTQAPDSPDLLELIRLGNPDPRAVHDESVSFLLAGHETTASWLSWTLYLLSLHPQILAKVRHEVDTVCGETFRSMKFEDSATATAEDPAKTKSDSNNCGSNASSILSDKQVGQLRYTAQVLKESLRLFPSVRSSSHLR
jgi:cytochrome P450